MTAVPTAPEPSDCDVVDGNTYTYTQDGTEGASYSLSYCLGAETGNVPAGVQTATPGGIY
jgi:hypothetical protein